MVMFAVEIKKGSGEEINGGCAVYRLVDFEESVSHWDCGTKTVAFRKRPSVISAPHTVTSHSQIYKNFKLILEATLFLVEVSFRLESMRVKEKPIVQVVSATAG